MSRGQGGTWWRGRKYLELAIHQGEGGCYKGTRCCLEGGGKEEEGGVGRVYSARTVETYCSCGKSQFKIRSRWEGHQKYRKKKQQCYHVLAMSNEHQSDRNFQSTLVRKWNVLSLKINVQRWLQDHFWTKKGYSYSLLLYEFDQLKTD